VHQAQAELERSVTEAKLHDDPIRFPLQAISTTLEAIHRLFVDGSLAIAQAAKAPQPTALTDKQFQEFTRIIGGRLVHSLKWEVWPIGWKPIVYGVLGGVALAVMCFGAGAWWQSSRNDSKMHWAESVNIWSDTALETCKEHVTVDKSGRRSCTLIVDLK
jgi:hypothetical protein